MFGLRAYLKDFSDLNFFREIGIRLKVTEYQYFIKFYTRR